MIVPEDLLFQLYFIDKSFENDSLHLFILDKDNEKYMMIKRCKWLKVRDYLLIVKDFAMIYIFHNF